MLPCLLALGGAAFAQQPTTDFREDPRFPAFVQEGPVVSDMELFNVPLEGSYDLFSRLAQYNFRHTRYLRRGYGYGTETVYANGLDLSRADDGWTDYTLLSTLRYMPSGFAYTAGLGMGQGSVGSLCGIGEFSVRPSDAPSGGRVALLASDRAARAGVRASYCGRAGKWGYSALLSRRWGRDAQVDGVFLDEWIAAAALERRFGGSGSLTLMVSAAPTVRSSRGSATAEAFALAGDNLYNPAWGWYQDKQRSSRVHDDLTPRAMLVYRGALDERHTLNVSAGYTFGHERYSGLTWFDAQNPLPDYHRYMPSWTGSEASLWDDSRQIGWQEMANQNILAGGKAHYVVDEDTRQISDLQLHASVDARLGARLTAFYGVRGRLADNRYYDCAGDLLGASWFADVDQFLVNDDYTGSQAVNDLRNPGRRVAQGDEFGYHYRIRRSSAAVFGALRYGDRRLRLTAGFEGGNIALQREGLYEKERQANSFGRSETLRFFDYTLKLSAGYSLSPRHILDLQLLSGSRAPGVDDAFLSPRYSNSAAPDLRATRMLGGEVSYRLTLPALRVKLTGYYTRTTAQTEVFHYYDDIFATYGNLAMGGVSKTYYGAELGAQVVFSHRISLLVAAAANSARYTSDPLLSFYSEADASQIFTGVVSQLTDYRVGGSPQTVATGELRYNGVKGWQASVAVNYTADAYIYPDPTRRTRQTTAYAASPEAFDEMVAQEKFPAAVTLSMFVSKTFRLRHGSLVALLSADNLLDERDIVWGGYEQMRMRRADKGLGTTYSAYASKYTYARGRSWYASVIYRF